MNAIPKAWANADAVELARRMKILHDMDTSAYECAGCLIALVDGGLVTARTAVRAVERFRTASSDYHATNALDKAAT